jgi:hypothetical protein
MLELGKPVTEVTVTIIQPRFEGAKPVRDFQFSALELLDFAADLKDAAELTRLPSPPLVAGDHCGFCPAARDCSKLAEKQRDLVKADLPVAGAYDVPAFARARKFRW